MEPQNPSSGGGETSRQPVEFSARPVEQPILGQDFRDRMALESKARAGFNWKAFFKSNKYYIWAILAGLAIIGVLAFFAFRKSPPQALKEANLDFVIESPQAVPSGGEAVWYIKIKNNDSEKLVDLGLELVYPEGVSYVGSNPKAENLSGSSYRIASLMTRENPVIMVKTRVLGGINEEKKLVAKLNYKYSSSSLEFSKTAESSVRITASDMVLEWSGPDNANNAQLVSYLVKYRNNSQEDIKNARLQLGFPPGFDVAESQPQADMGKNIWNLGTISAGGEGSVTVQGSFGSANPGESLEFIAEILTLGKDGQYFPQAQSSHRTAVSSLPLLVSQELEHGDGMNLAKPGDDLRFRVKYQNNSPVAASGINIIVTLDSKSLDLSTLQAEGGEINNNTILWNAATVPNLETLNPSDSGQLSFSVRVKNPATRDSSKNLTVVSSIKIRSNEYETYLPGNQLALKITSPVSMSSQLDFVSGSLPPKVGKATTYKVRLGLRNSSNDYSDGRVELFLPASGSLVPDSFNLSEASKTSFDASTGKLIWNFGNLPAHTGTFQPQRFLEFQIRINPSPAQAGSEVTLAKDIKLEARDLFTNQTVPASLDNLATSDLSGDHGYSQGQVEQ